MTAVSFYAAGKATPQGSTRGFVVNGKAVITSASKGLSHWRTIVATQAQGVFSKPFAGAVRVEVRFYLPRPKSYPKSYVPAYRRPDLDKLIRAIFDALSHIAWIDDAQVTEVVAGKEYATGVPGVMVTVEQLWEPPVKRSKAKAAA